MSSLPRVLISILNYNDNVDVIETIECFYKQSYSNFDIQLIDNSSTNNCVNIIKERYPSLKLIVLNENLGYAGGNNIAFDIGLKNKYDYVLISNNDVAVNNNVVSDLVSTSINNSEAGVIGLIEKDYYSGNIKVIGGYGFKPINGKGQWSKTFPSIEKEYLEVDYVQGALVMFTNNALSKGLRFDEKLFMYCEEVDMQFALKERGFKAIVSLENTVQHKGVPNKFYLLQGYYIQRNRIYLSKKHGNKWQYIIAILYTTLFELPVKCVVRSIQGYPNYALYCCLGFIDGIKGKMYNKRIN